MVNQNKKQKISIKIVDIIMLIFLIVLILPDDFFSIGTIYTSSTPSFIRSKRLDFHLGIIHIFILTCGSVRFLRFRKKFLLIIPLLMFLREGIKVLCGEDSLFYTHSYEMYLVIFIAYTLQVCVVDNLRTFSNWDKFFKLYLITNVASIYLNFLIKASKIIGRYNASNLDVGGTGVICVICVLYFSFIEKKKWKDYVWSVLAGIGLYLSGSRANFVFLILIGFLSFWWKAYLEIFVTRRISKSYLYKKFIIFFGIIIAMGIFTYVLGEKIIVFISNTRLLENMSSIKISSDDSVLGRMASLKAGWDIIKSHPFGISGYYINLQYEMQNRGYPTFPHSTLMSSYILHGPIVFGVYVVWAWIIRKQKYLLNRYFWIIVYFFISTIVYGSPVTNFKVMFTYMFVTFTAIQNIKLNQNESKRER